MKNAAPTERQTKIWDLAGEALQCLGDVRAQLKDMGVDLSVMHAAFDSIYDTYLSCDEPLRPRERAPLADEKKP